MFVDVRSKGQSPNLEVGNLRGMGGKLELSESRISQLRNHAAKRRRAVARRLGESNQYAKGPRVARARCRPASAYV